MFILIPAYKPDERLIKLTEDIHRMTDFGILVIDDGSGKDFQHIFEALPNYVIKLKHEVNQGKGRAMKTGFEYLLKSFPGEPCVICDADGQHTPSDAKKIASELEKYPDSLVIGCRKFGNDIPFRSRFGNKLTVGVFALASGKKVSDTQTGLRGIPASAMKFFSEIPGERYEYEMNMLLYAVEDGIDIKEVGIDTIYIDNNSSSHFNVVRDSIKIYSVILKYAAVSILSFLIDYVLLLIFDAVFNKGFTSAKSLLYATMLARVISSAFNFAMNKKMVFKNKAGIASTAVKYFLLALTVLALKYVVLFALNDVLNITLAIADIIAEVLLFNFSYIMQRKFVFKNKRR